MLRGIEGTYQLVSRKLPDGTVQSPPNIMGALTYTKTHRNFNVIWKEAQGKFFLIFPRFYVQTDAH